MNNNVYNVNNHKQITLITLLIIIALQQLYYCRMTNINIHFYVTKMFDNFATFYDNILLKLLKI